METLSVTEPHYIRCVKPNNVLKPAIFENINIIHQLRCGVSIFHILIVICKSDFVGSVDIVGSLTAFFSFPCIILVFNFFFRVFLRQLGLAALAILPDAHLTIFKIVLVFWHQKF